MKRGMKIRRILSVVLIMLILTTLVSSCGSSGKTRTVADPETAPHVTLALRSGIYVDAIESCLADFESENQVICDIVELGEEELHTEIMEDAKNETGKYDLCMVDGSWMAEFTAEKALLNLSENGYEIDDDIIEGTRKICYSDGDVYLAPYYGNVTVLLFSKNVVEKAGYSADDMTCLKEYMDVCKKATENGNLGFMYRGDSANNYVVDFLPILLSYGGWVVDDNNNPTIDTPQFKEAMDFYKELIATGKAEKRDELIMAIANGAAAMAVGWPGWYTPTAKSSSDYIAITGKVTDDDNAYNANVYGIWAIGIPDNCPNKELSMKLFNYLMDKDVQKSTIEYGGVPCRYSSLQDEDILAENPQFHAVFDALEGGVYRPVMKEWPDFYTVLVEEMSKIISEEKTVEDGLKDAQRKLEEILGN